MVKAAQQWAAFLCHTANPPCIDVYMPSRSAAPKHPHPARRSRIEALLGCFTRTSGKAISRASPGRAAYSNPAAYDVRLAQGRSTLTRRGGTGLKLSWDASPIPAVMPSPAPLQAERRMEAQLPKMSGWRRGEASPPGAAKQDYGSLGMLRPFRR